MRNLRPARPVAAAFLLAAVLTGCGGTDPATTDSAAADVAAGGGPVTGAVAVAEGSELAMTVTQVVTAVEGCAAANTDASFTGCLDYATLVGTNPALAELTGDVLIGPGTQPPNSYDVTASSGDMSYTSRHGADGSIAKTCTGCPAGTW